MPVQIATQGLVVSGKKKQSSNFKFCKLEQETLKKECSGGEG